MKKNEKVHISKCCCSACNACVSSSMRITSMSEKGGKPGGGVRSGGGQSSYPGLQSGFHTQNQDSGQSLEDLQYLELLSLTFCQQPVLDTSHCQIGLKSRLNPYMWTILCAERWCCLRSLLGYWAQSWTGRHSDTAHQHAGTHFADLGRMTGRANPTWY